MSEMIPSQHWIPKLNQCRREARADSLTQDVLDPQLNLLGL